MPVAHPLPSPRSEYSPDSEHLLSCSADSVHVWSRSGPEPSPLHEEDDPPPRTVGEMCDQPDRALRFPKGTSLRIARVHPAWTSVLLATNEALEVRELIRTTDAFASPSAAASSSIAASSSAAPSASSSALSPVAASAAPAAALPHLSLSASGGRLLAGAHRRSLPLKWRRENMQITAAAFIAQGNMLVVSDRGDRLLLLNYHGLHAAKRCVLPWESPHSSSPLGLGFDDELDERARGACSRGVCAGGVCTGGVTTVTSIVECPDVAKAEEWRSGVSQLAVANSRGDVLLIKI